VEGKKKTVILRMYEHMGGHASVRLILWVFRHVRNLALRLNVFATPSRGIHATGASIVNILEEEIAELDIVTDEESEAIDLEFRAFEIKTIQVRL